MRKGDLVKVNSFAWNYFPAIGNRVCIILDVFTSKYSFDMNSKNRVSIIVLSQKGEFIKYDLQESWVTQI